MKKITLGLAIFASLLGTSNLSAELNNQSIFLTSNVSNPVEGSGTVIELTENGGRLIEDGTGNTIEFIRPEVSNVIIGEHYDFLKIVQNTPNGSRVINILKTKMPQ